MKPAQALRIGVIGGGAMGSLLAGRLSLRQASSPASHAAHIALLPIRTRATGQCRDIKLHLLDRGPNDAPIDVSLSTAVPPEGVDVAVLLTKSAFLAPAVDRLLPLLPPARPGLVVSLMNGVGYEDMLRPIAARHNLVFGVTSAAARFYPDGLHETGRGSTIIAAKAHPGAAALVALMNEAGLQASVCESVESMRWTKLAVNCALNPLTAIHRVRNGDLLQIPGVVARVRRILVEVEALAAAKGIVLQTSDLFGLVSQVAHNTRLNQSSMFVDVLNKSRTEIEYMNGTIVRESQALGLLSPENASVYEEIKLIETSYAPDSSSQKE